MKQYLYNTEIAWLRLPGTVRRMLWGAVMSLTITGFLIGHTAGINETEMRKAQARLRLAQSIERHPMTVAVISEEDVKETGYRMKGKDIKESTTARRR